jgi:Fur family transcriptional regulator, ferric uptake regulator
MDQHKLRLQRLRDAGHKVTKARQTILEVLESHHEHLTSAQVVDEVAQRDSSIGRASVFRALDLFTQLAIVRPTYIESSMSPHYVLLPDGHHHHIICMQCHRVIEFQDCGLSELADRLEVEFDVQLTGHLLEFYGICKNCIHSDK